MLFIPDTHSPYEDKHAWRLLMLFVKRWKPDIIIILGDFADFYQVSDHDKDPGRSTSFKDEIDHTNALLDELEKLETMVYFCEGNHEFRMTRYIQREAPELYGIVSVRELLKIEKRRWTWIPYLNDRLIYGTFITHKLDVAGGTAITKLLNHYRRNCVMGHGHRGIMQYENTHEGKLYFGAMFGWLGDASAIDYEHRSKVTRWWALGFGTAHVIDDKIFAQFNPIQDRMVVVDGEVYSL